MACALHPRLLPPLCVPSRSPLTYRTTPSFAPCTMQTIRLATPTNEFSSERQTPTAFSRSSFALPNDPFLSSHLRSLASPVLLFFLVCASVQLRCLLALSFSFRAVVASSNPPLFVCSALCDVCTQQHLFKLFPQFVQSP